MISLEGKIIAARIFKELKEEISRTKLTLRLAVIMVGDDEVSRQYVGQKKRDAESVGIEISIHPFSSSISTSALRNRVSEIVHHSANTGVIVQLPISAHINRQKILDAVIPEKDVDVLSSHAFGKFMTGKSLVLPPMVGAIETLLEEYHVPYRGVYAVVAGYGSLVGKPVSHWLMGQGCTVSVVRKETPHPEEFYRRADLIVMGANEANILTGDMVREGVAVIDAGTVIMNGRTYGNVVFDSLKEKAMFLSPVPGGVGRLTIARLLQNVMILGS